MSERCPHCLIPPQRIGFSPVVCSKIGESLTQTSEDEIKRSPNCPFPRFTDGNCNILSGQTIQPRIEIRIGDGGKRFRVRS